VKNWNVESDDGSTFRMPSRDQIREKKHKDFNIKQKSVMKSIGENMASLGCVLVVLLFVGYIWTDMKIQIFSELMICDALVSVVSFILVEDLMSQNGIKCGKLYDDYINAYKAYRKICDEVSELGITHLNDFCDMQVEREYQGFLKKKCRELKIDYDEYVNKYSKMQNYELRFHFRDKVKAYRVACLSKIEPIELTPEMLLMDDVGEHKERGGIGISAQGYIKKKTHGAFNIIATIVTCIFSASIAFAANDGASWGLVMYTLLKLSLLVWRMVKGYNEGVRAYNTYEVRSLQDRTMYLTMYIEYIKKGILGEEYGTEGNRSAQVDPQGRREGEGGGVLHDRPAESVRASASG
jgi:hypothetical protein